MSPLVVAEISNEAIRTNLRILRGCLSGGAAFCPAVKANAYGHGLQQVIDVLSGEDVYGLAVANLEEAIEVRRLGWSRPVMCFAPMLASGDEGERRERAEQAAGRDIALTVMSVAEARVLAEAGARLGRRVHVEVKVDTGMGRMGLLPTAAATLVGEIARIPGLTIDGVYTHLATADEPSLDFAREQLAAFAELRLQLAPLRDRLGHFHAANSAAIVRLPESHLDRVRPGISLYGYWCGPADERPAGLRPAMRVVGQLTAVRRLPAGYGVGYGRAFVTPRDSVIGVVPIGYADGYRRLLSNDGVMTLDAVRGQPSRQVPVVGRVSMDQTTIDVTDAGDVRAGDPVIVIDHDPVAANSVEELARRLQTIPYEITCLIGARVCRVHPSVA